MSHRNNEKTYLKALKINRNKIASLWNLQILKKNKGIL